MILLFRVSVKHATIHNLAGPLLIALFFPFLEQPNYFFSFFLLTVKILSSTYIDSNNHILIQYWICLVLKYIGYFTKCTFILLHEVRSKPWLENLKNGLILLPQCLKHGYVIYKHVKKIWVWYSTHVKSPRPNTIWPWAAVDWAAGSQF